MIDCRTGTSVHGLGAQLDANMLYAPDQANTTLANYERRPLLDKALSGTYPPGLTFRP